MFNGWKYANFGYCGWTGEPVAIDEVPEPPDEDDRKPPDGECIVPTVPLIKLRKPSV